VITNLENIFYSVETDYMLLVGRLWLNWAFCRISAWEVCFGWTHLKLLGQTELVLLFLLQDCLQFGKWPVTHNVGTGGEFIQ